MFRLAEILRKLKEKLLYLSTYCTCSRIAVGLVFELNDHQHTYTELQRTHLKHNCYRPEIHLSTDITLPLSVLNTRLAVR